MDFSKTTFQLGLGIRFHLTERTVQSFAPGDVDGTRKIWETMDPARLFVRSRIFFGSEHSKSVFVTGELARGSFIEDAFQCWDFPPALSH